MLNRQPQSYIEDGVGKIALRRTDGSVRAWTFVDAADFEAVAQFNWCLIGGTYAGRNVPTPQGRRQEFLARRLLGLSYDDPLQVDHKDRDKLNNRRSNLRVVTHAQNVQNSPSKRGTSRFRGVSWRPDMSKWRAEATCGKKRIYAYFADELEAAAFAADARRQILPYAVD